MGRPMILRLDDGLRWSGSELIDADIIIPIKLYPGQARRVTSQGWDSEFWEIWDGRVVWAVWMRKEVTLKGRESRMWDFTDQH